MSRFEGRNNPPDSAVPAEGLSFPRHPSLALSSAEHSHLSGYSPDEQATIIDRLQTLSVLPYYIGKDFDMPVRLNAPREGWHWNFVVNEVRVDPEDLLKKPLDFSRFVICHEGAHRRITRISDRVKEFSEKPGFAFLNNCIEDPRVNNFACLAYPYLDPKKELAYSISFDLERKNNSWIKKHLGFRPRAVEAALGFIKAWLEEERTGKPKVDQQMPRASRDVVEKCLPSAVRAWHTYPSRDEANQGDHLVKRYSDHVESILIREIWPEYEKLVGQDLKSLQLSKLLSSMQGNTGNRSGSGMPKDQKGAPQNSATPEVPAGLSKTLTESERKELKQALERASKASDERKSNENKQSSDGVKSADSDKKMQGDNQLDTQTQHGSSEAKNQAKDTPVNLDDLSEGLKEKLEQYLNSLPLEEQERLAKEAQEVFNDYQEELNYDLESKEQSAAKSTDGSATQRSGSAAKFSRAGKTQGAFNEASAGIINRNLTEYDRLTIQDSAVIRKLETHLRTELRKRRIDGFESGYVTGERVNFPDVIAGSARRTPVSRPYERRNQSSDFDYSFSLITDLSPSMRGEKVKNAFRGAAVIGEATRRVMIPTAIYGFNSGFYEFKRFDQAITREVKELIGGMVKSTGGSTDLYWAIDQASERAQSAAAKRHVLLVLTDGVNEPSRKHRGSAFSLEAVLGRVTERGNQRVLVLGLGISTEELRPHLGELPAIGGIQADQLSQVLARVVEKIFSDKPLYGGKKLF